MPQSEYASSVADGFFGPPLRMRIRPRPAEVGRARHWFRDSLRHLAGAAAGGTSAADAAEAVFAEVTANAVRHGRGRVTVTVAVVGGRVHCSVRDGGWHLPRLTPAWQPDLEDGRGMVIIEALADCWGVHRHLLGKTVWFEVRVPVPPCRARPAVSRPGTGLPAARPAISLSGSSLAGTSLPGGPARPASLPAASYLKTSPPTR